MLCNRAKEESNVTLTSASAVRCFASVCDGCREPSCACQEQKVLWRASQRSDQAFFPSPDLRSVVHKKS